MVEPIAVEVRFEMDGSYRPLAFDWKGYRYVVESHGRQWEENGVQHFLVMVTGDRVFELGYHETEKQWVLFRHPQDFKVPPVV